jgi:capsid portal protein
VSAAKEIAVGQVGARTLTINDGPMVNPDLRFALPKETDEQQKARETWAKRHHEKQQEFVYAVEIAQQLRRIEERCTIALARGSALRSEQQARLQRGEDVAELSDAIAATDEEVAVLVQPVDLVAEVARARAQWLSTGLAPEAAFRVVQLEHELQRAEQRNALPPVRLLVDLARARAELRVAAPVREGSEQLNLDWFIRQGIIVPPWVDPRRALDTVNNSDVLSACIWCMAKNVGGHGYEFVCHLSPAAIDDLKAQGDVATLDEIEEEKLRLDRFFRDCNPAMSFLEIRRRSTADKWGTGWSVWEILRDGKNEIAGLEPMWSWTTGLTPLSDPIDCKIPVQSEDGEWVEVETTRRFNLVVQVIYGQYRYFKTIGDPRVVDRFNGRVAQNEAEENAIKAAGREAHEVALFIHYGTSGGIAPYGMPPWLGATYSALGRKAAAEVNLLFWDNKGVPPLVVTVSGGQLTNESGQQVVNHFKKLKGRDAFHDVLVLEAIQGAPADPMDPQGRNQMRIEVKELSSWTEATHREYSQDCIRDVRMPFGLPAISLGLSDDYTRATADAAMVVADREVFQPERESEDHFISHVLFPYLGIRFHSFKTRGAHVVDEETIAGLLETACANDIVTVDEARAILATYFGHALPAHNAPWSTRPISINKAQAALGTDFTAVGVDKAPVAAVPIDGDPEKVPPEESVDGAGDSAGSGDGGSVEADQAGAAAATDAPGAKDPEQKHRVLHARVPAEWLEGAEVIDGVFRLRDKIQQELLTRAVEEARAGG